MKTTDSRTLNLRVLPLIVLLGLVFAPAASPAKPKTPAAKAAPKASPKNAAPAPPTVTAPAAPVVAPPAGTAPQGLPFKVESATQGWGTLQYDKSVTGAALAIAGKTYASGLGTHAFSRITLTFPSTHKKFSGRCGINDQPGNPGSAIFKVLNGDKVLFESKKLTGGAAAADFSVNVTGLSRLTLVVEEAGDGFASDHADWVDLKLD